MTLLLEVREPRDRPTARARSCSASTCDVDAGRGGRAARPQRHGQDHHGALDHGADPRRARARSASAASASTRWPRRTASRRAGIALVPEGRQIFPNLSVRENLVAFAANRSGARRSLDARRACSSCFRGCTSAHGNMGNQLSGGEQQMLAIGRALVTNPQLLILDEATEGLAPLVREEIWRCLARLRAAGQAILVIDKYVERLVEARRPPHHHRARARRLAAAASAELDADRGLWHRYLGV